MRKVYLVSKTHLDLGFTDYAKNIQQRYIDEFIPAAISIAQKTNIDGKKFVWATGSWILYKALHGENKSKSEELLYAMRRGDIIAHGLPLTTHTELLDIDTVRYGLEIGKKLDAMLGKKTVWAKMTDVPGHTISLVPLLAEYGIKLLHIGVNGASTLPNVPPLFLWKNGDSQVIVIYESSYGSEFCCEYTNDIICFAHTSDNHGSATYKQSMYTFERLSAKYPDAEVVAGGLDEIADKLWEIRDKLPIITTEIGDSWIHGSASDPFKSAALRELILLKNNWLSDGSLVRYSDEKDSEMDKAKCEEYENMTDKLLCIAEHTCGMDTKKYFADYNNYLKKDFVKAKSIDKVKNHLFPLDNFLSLMARLSGNYETGSYKAVEKSWAEQREYIQECLDVLSPQHRQEATARLAILLPKQPPAIEGEQLDFDKEYKFGDIGFSINKFGALSLSFGNEKILDAKGALVDYQSFGEKDYEYWKKHYTRDFKHTFSWASGDFLRPNLKKFNSKFEQGRWNYKVTKACLKDIDNCPVVGVELSIDKRLSDDLGAPRKIVVQYFVEEKSIKCVIEWFGKDENRLTEAIFAHFYPMATKENLRYTKIGGEVNPYDVVENGNRNLSAVQDYHFDCGEYSIVIEPRDNPLVGLGKGKILQFDNVFEDVAMQGVASLLYDNVWGTNFPLWYGQNAHFETNITIEKKSSKE